MFKMKIETDNAAFDDGERMHEVARILREVADKIDAARMGGTILDGNGNSIGRWDCYAGEEESGQ